MIAGVLPQWRMPAQRSRLTADIAAVRPDDAAVLVMLARAFHAEEARTLDAAGEAALVAIAQGEKSCSGVAGAGWRPAGNVSLNVLLCADRQQRQRKAARKQDEKTSPMTLP